MRKIYSALLFVSCIFLSLNVRSQNCSTCATTDTIAYPGFINLDSIPCIVQGEPYSYAIPFHMFSTFTVSPVLTVTIDSIHFIDITNLPCGMCWSSSSPPLNSFKPNQNGCILISGTSMDSAGQFQAAISLYAYYNGVGVPVPASTVSSSGIKLVIRVVSPTGTCAPPDTAAGAQNLQTSTSLCATAVNNIPGYISLFDVYPNPLNSDASVSFTALEGGAYTLKLTDVTGKTLRTEQIQAVAGINRTDLARQQLPAGIYFISLSNKLGMITKKLLVTD